MAFNSALGRTELTASAGQTVFPFLFKIYNDGDIKVYQTPAGDVADDTADILTLTTDYTVTITGDTGGSITLVSGATLNDSITIVRELDINRDVEFQTSGDMLATTLNIDQNYQTYLIADQEANSDRQLRLPSSVQGVSSDLPAPVSLNFLRWNQTADALENINSLQADGFLWTAADVYTKTETNTLLDLKADLAGATFTGTFEFAKGADVASATALPILSDGNYFDVTGTTTITSIATTGNVGTVIKLHFDAILTLTHHATDLILPSGANITTAAGDEAEFIEYASGDFRCTNYTKADGKAVIATYGDSDVLSLFNAAGSAPVYATRAWVDFDGSGTVTINGSGNISSVTDVGAGDYTPNLTVNMADTNYSATIGGVRAIGTPSGWMSVHTKAVGSFNINTTNASGTLADWDNVSVEIVR